MISSWGRPVLPWLLFIFVFYVYFQSCPQIIQKSPEHLLTPSFPFPPESSCIRRSSDRPDQPKGKGAHFTHLAPSQGARCTASRLLPPYPFLIVKCHLSPKYLSNFLKSKSDLPFQVEVGKAFGELYKANRRFWQYLHPHRPTYKSHFIQI